MNKQALQAIQKGLEIDRSHITVYRGESVHYIVARISYEAGGVWGYKYASAGMTIETTPYIFGLPSLDIEEGDVIMSKTGWFQIGAITIPTLGGRPVCKQAPLTAIDAPEEEEEEEPEEEEEEEDGEDD